MGSARLVSVQSGVIGPVDMVLELPDEDIREGMVGVRGIPWVALSQKGLNLRAGLRSSLRTGSIEEPWQSGCWVYIQGSAIERRRRMGNDRCSRI